MVGGRDVRSNGCIPPACRIPPRASRSERTRQHEREGRRRTEPVGRLAVVTGASDGLGLRLAHGLARAGAELILPVRNERKGAEAVAEITPQRPARRATAQIPMPRCVRRSG
ncbi:MAG: SDR family NAD(P)-dependent oxidoreductase [Mycobacterium sp.]